MSTFIYSTKKETLSPQEVINLYVRLGWGGATDYNEKIMDKALKNTTMVISARKQSGELIGLTRILSDGHIHTSIADIVVHSDYRNQGVGKEMMELVKKHYGHTGIFINAFEENEVFFGQCGYKKRQMQVFSKQFKESNQLN